MATEKTIKRICREIPPNLLSSGMNIVFVEGVTRITIVYLKWQLKIGNHKPSFHEGLAHYPLISPRVWFQFLYSPSSERRDEVLA